MEPDAVAPRKTPIAECAKNDSVRWSDGDERKGGVHGEGVLVDTWEGTVVYVSPRTAAKIARIYGFESPASEACIRNSGH